MLTVKDINNKRFEQARPGYSPAEVDDFLREISKEITRYQKEKEETDKKIEVLVESVREYKKDEEALKDALIGAQKQGRAVITEAQEKAESILSNATVKAGEIIGSTKIQLEKERQSLSKMQKEVSDFKRELLAMYKQHLEQITAIPEFEDEEEETAAEAVRAETAEAAESDFSYAASEYAEEDELEKFSAAESSEEAAKEALDEIAAKPAEKSPFDDLKNPNRSRFGDLKFGNNTL